MRTIDLIRKYIEREKTAGHLKPGDRLPTYHELMRISGGSYSTVHLAMTKLEKDGLIRIEHGNGSWLAGGTPIEIKLVYPMEMISATEMTKLIQKHATLGMNFSFKCRSCYAPEESGESKIPVIHLVEKPTSGARSPSDFSGMDDYAQTVSWLIPAKYQWPFSFTTYQIGVNPRFFRSAEVELPKKSGNFGWWHNYAAGCRKAGLAPASIIWNRNTRNAFQILLPFVFALNGGKISFEGKPGDRFFDILTETVFFHDDLVNLNPKSFYQSGAGMDFCIGSWIAVQNNHPRRSDIRIDELDVVPYSVGTQRLLPVTTTFLETWLPEDCTAETKNRVWELLKLLVSHEFQRDFCALSGQISARTDMKPEDYSWASDERWRGFFPCSDDMLVDTTDLLPPGFVEMSTMAIELWKFASLNSDILRKHLSFKLNPAKQETQFYHS